MAQDVYMKKRPTAQKMKDTGVFKKLKRQDTSLAIEYKKAEAEVDKFAALFTIETNPGNSEQAYLRVCGSLPSLMMAALKELSSQLTDERIIISTDDVATKIRERLCKSRIGTDAVLDLSARGPFSDTLLSSLGYNELGLPTTANDIDAIDSREHEGALERGLQMLRNGNYVQGYYEHALDEFKRASDNYALAPIPYAHTTLVTLLALQELHVFEGEGASQRGRLPCSGSKDLAQTRMHALTKRLQSAFDAYINCAYLGP